MKLGELIIYTLVFISGILFGTWLLIDRDNIRSQAIKDYQACVEAGGNQLYCEENI